MNLDDLSERAIPFLGWYLEGAAGPGMALPSYSWYASEDRGTARFKLTLHTKAEFTARAERFERAKVFGLSLIKGMIFLGSWQDGHDYELELPATTRKLEAKQLRDAIARALLRIRNEGHRKGDYVLDVPGIAYALSVEERDVIVALEALKDLGLIADPGTNTSNVTTGVLWLTGPGIEYVEGLDHSSQAAAGEDVLRVVLFLDIVGSTILTEKLGDQAFQLQANSLDVEARHAIGRFGGDVLTGKRVGDGLVALFGSGRKAVDAAITCRQIARERDLQLHVGLHVGDVTRTEIDASGGTMNYAARVCDACPPDEILVSETFRDAIRTSSRAVFDGPIESQLKGISGVQRLYRLSSDAHTNVPTP